MKGLGNGGSYLENHLPFIHSFIQYLIRASTLLGADDVKIGRLLPSELS